MRPLPWSVSLLAVMALLTGGCLSLIIDVWPLLPKPPSPPTPSAIIFAPTPPLLWPETTYRQPVLRSMRATPGLRPGDTLEVTADVVAPDPSALKFDWSVIGGSLVSTDQGKAFWQVPKAPGAFQCRLTVSDESGVRLRAAKIAIIEGSRLEVYPETLTLPPPGYPYARLSVPKANGRRLVTIAGKTTNGWSGDGGPASEATFGNYLSIAFDSQGNLYVADTANHCIRRIDGKGMIMTVAGNRVAGFGGDGGPAMAASLNGPTGLTVDDTDRLLICDTKNNRIRRVNVDGTITTVTDHQNGALVGPSRLVVTSDGHLFVICRAGIRRLDAAGDLRTVAIDGDEYGGDGGSVGAAHFTGLRGLAMGPLGDLYVVDGNNSRVRRIADDGYVETVAGFGQMSYTGDGGPAVFASFDSPGDVVVDRERNFYVTDYVGRCVRKVDTSGIISTFVSDLSFEGLNSKNTQFSPANMAISPSGDLYITSSGRVLKVKIDP